MDPILATLIGGGFEIGKLLLMAYMENQRLAGKSKEEIEAYMKAVADEYFALPDPTVILQELAANLAKQMTEAVAAGTQVPK